MISYDIATVIPSTSHAKVLPTVSLTLSMNVTIFSMQCPPQREKPGAVRSEHAVRAFREATPGRPDGIALYQSALRLLLPFEVMVVRDPVVHVDPQLPGNYALRPRLLACHDLGKERVCAGMFFDQPIPGFELCLQDLLWRSKHPHASLRFQLLEIDAVARDRPEVIVGRFREDCSSHDRLQLGGERFPLPLVDSDFELLHGLVETLQHVHLPDIGEAQGFVRGRIIELGGIDDPPLERRYHLAARKNDHRSSHIREQLCREAYGAVLGPLELLRLEHGGPEPP